MDTYEYSVKKRKVSPFADSPYECAFAQENVQEQPKESMRETPKAAGRKHGKGKLLITFIILVACCVGTAIGVSSIWEGRMDRMETAMNEKFDALKELYEEAKLNSGSQIPEQGPMTPGQVYAKNVQAVVAIHSQYSNGIGAGSGFILSEDGYVVTNYHVIEGANQVAVVTHNGKSSLAEVIGYDAGNDVALLKIDGKNLPFVTLGSSDALSVGDCVAAIGNPLGELTSTLTVGYISAKDRVVDTDGTVINMLQTDAAINSGNSGGPLFDMNGKVIGIITAKYSGNSGSGATIEGLGFAIPIDDVAGMISDLKEYGYVTGPYLGVYVRDVEESAQYYGLPAGAYVESTEKGYAAEAAGIRAGDIIVNVGGYDVDSVTTLTRMLRKFKAGDTISVTVYRSGKLVYLAATLDEKPVQTQQEESTEPEGGSIFDDWWSNLFPPAGGE